MKYLITDNEIESMIKEAIVTELIHKYVLDELGGFDRFNKEAEELIKDIPVESLRDMISTVIRSSGQKRLTVLELVKFHHDDCPFMEGWKNEEGWLVGEGGELICLDWDTPCTKCRVDDSKDYIFAVDEDVVKSSQLGFRIGEDPN